MAGIIENISRGWNRDPSGRLDNGRPRGLSAALWQEPESTIKEFYVAADPNHHILAIRLNAYSTEFTFNGRAEHKGAVAAGSIIFTRAGDAPCAVNKGPWKTLHIYVPIEVTDQIANHEAIGDIKDSPLKSEAHFIDARIERSGREILSEMQLGLPLAQLRIDCLGRDLATLLARRHLPEHIDRITREAERLRASDWRFRRAAEMLQDRLADDIGVKELARIVGLSAVHLTGLFKQATGLPPHQWLMRCRLEKACGMLRETDEAITDIALQCGCASSQHMSTMFRRHLAQTPSSYRRAR